jgi:3-oxoacyl-[acyl-carrier protein] reductase
MVIGANRGIGLSITRRFQELGDRVTATYRTEASDLTDVRQIPCDITDPDSVNSAFASVEDATEFAEIVIINAGITSDNLLVRMTDEEYIRVIETNLTGAWRVTRRALATMTKQRRGSIVYVSSIAGHTGSPGQANYAAAKAGLDGLARTVAREYARRNIRANVVAPGPVDTDMTRALTEDQLTKLIGEIPLGRLGTADEVAEAVCWVAGASFVTGAFIPVGGGLGIGY